MTSTLAICNRQQTWKINVRLFRQMARLLLRECFCVKNFELGVHLVEAPEMMHINEHFLRHAGSTDVITFAYNETEAPERLAGEIFICVTEAQIQAKRYHTGLASELLRYLIHGLLHLRGYDDKTAKLRRPMKREEDRLLREITQRFPLQRLAQL